MNTPKPFHVNGMDWTQVPVRLRCLLGFHRAQTMGWVDLDYIERCSCGAFGPSPWVRIDPFPWKSLWRTRA